MRSFESILRGNVSRWIEQCLTHDQPDEQTILASSLMILRADMPDTLSPIDEWNQWLHACTVARHALGYVRAYPADTKGEL